MSRWTNADGLQVPFGNYWKNPRNFKNRPRSVNTLGAEKEIVIDVDLTLIPAGTVSYTSDLNNDGTLDGFNTGDIYLPAFASVKQAYIVMTEAAAGGTSISVGTFTRTGTPISATSIMTATEGAIANLDTRGARTYGAGALVAATAETASVGSADAYIGITTAGTFTAGKGRLVIIYTDPNGDSA